MPQQLQKPHLHKQDNLGSALPHGSPEASKRQFFWVVATVISLGLVRALAAPGSQRPQWASKEDSDGPCVHTDCPRNHSAQHFPTCGPERTFWSRYRVPSGGHSHSTL